MNEFYNQNNNPTKATNKHSKPSHQLIVQTNIQNEKSNKEQTTTKWNNNHYLQQTTMDKPFQTFPIGDYAIFNNRPCVPHLNNNNTIMKISKQRLETSKRRTTISMNEH